MMADLPEVTVIVVTYNHANYVLETLDSIAAQTLQPTKLILVDDASSDDTVQIVESWNEQHGGKATVLAHVTNTGLCRGLNEALNLVRTSLYAYISGDDRMAPQRLELQVKRWVDDGGRAAGVYSNARRIDEAGQELQPDYRTEHFWPEVLEGKVHAELLRRDWMPAASLLLSTEAVRKVGAYDERWFFEDYDLLLRLAREHRFLVVDEPLVDFRTLPTSLGSTRFNDGDTGFLAARVGIWSAQYGVTPEGDAWLRRSLPPLAIRLWRTGDHPEVAQAGLLATAEGPALNLRLRAAMISAGIHRQPRGLTALSALAGWARRHLRRR